MTTISLAEADTLVIRGLRQDQQALYHCPKLSCRKDFKSIAGLINHLESETCGFMRFADVQRRAQDMMKGGRLLAY